MELNRITITQSMDDTGKLDVDLSDGIEFIRAIGMLETAKLELYDSLPQEEDGDGVE